MKTKCYLFFWGVLLLGLLNSAEKTHESSVYRRRKVSKPDLAKSKGNRRQDLSTSDRGAPLHMLPQTKVRSDFAQIPDVSVSCSASEFFVRVKPAFYGLGADAQELRLGRSCRSNGILEPYRDLLFTYPLTACDGVRELLRGYLVYRFVLHYEPSRRRSRARGFSVDVECHYPREHHVHQLAVQPTWDTAVVRKTLKGRQRDFEITLMDDSWTHPTTSRVYQLGELINVQLSAPHLPPGGKLYVSHCDATPSGGSKLSIKYTIIDNFGCMLDSRREPGASQFISRTHKTLRFFLKAFQFTSDPDTEVNINCKLFVASGEPSPEHKSCTYKDNRWKALTGDDSICECCEWHCATSGATTAITEGTASSTPLLISDQPSLTEGSLLSIDRNRERNREFVEQQSHEKLWENADDDNDEDKENQQLEESRIKHGVTTSPGSIDDFSLMEGASNGCWGNCRVRDLDVFVEEGSTREEVKYSGSNEEELETFLSRVLVNVHEEENTQQAGRNEGSGGTVSPAAQWKNDSRPIGNQEETWFFTWK